MTHPQSQTALNQAQLEELKRLREENAAFNQQVDF
jgi:hypothetical protein